MTVWENRLLTRLGQQFLFEYDFSRALLLLLPRCIANKTAYSNLWSLADTRGIYDRLDKSWNCYFARGCWNFLASVWRREKKKAPLYLHIYIVEIVNFLVYINDVPAERDFIRCTFNFFFSGDNQMYQLTDYISRHLPCMLVYIGLAWMFLGRIYTFVARDRCLRTACKHIHT